MLPDNRFQAEKRVRWLTKKLLKNNQLHKDYVDFMQFLGIIFKNLAKNCRETNWLIHPNHGIYHPKKPGKLG